MKYKIDEATPDHVKVADIIRNRLKQLRLSLCQVHSKRKDSCSIVYVYLKDCKPDQIKWLRLWVSQFSSGAYNPMLRLLPVKEIVLDRPQVEHVEVIPECSKELFRVAYDVVRQYAHQVAYPAEWVVQARELPDHIERLDQTHEKFIKQICFGDIYDTILVDEIWSKINPKPNDACELSESNV